MDTARSTFEGMWLLTTAYFAIKKIYDLDCYLLAFQGKWLPNGGDH